MFLGAGMGGALRHGVGIAILRSGWTAFPAGTLLVNVLGSFLMSVLAEYFVVRAHLPPEWRLFLTTGVLGGFTTFSAFTLDAVLLYERGRVGLAAVYVCASIILSIAALFGGIEIVRPLVRT